MIFLKMRRNLAILIIFSVIVINIAQENCKQLKQVVILGRHNVRTPIAMNLATLTPKQWPKWKEKSGFLTEKGFILEGYMGKFISEWLIKEKLLPNNCPTEKEVFVYANVKQRTRKSAEAFVDSAFPNCNVPVHHNNLDNDPIFNPIIHNSTAAFRQLALEQMGNVIKSLHLNESYAVISDILDYEDSVVCKVGKKCNLITDLNKVINLVKGMKPNIAGPLKISNSVIDAFIMEYYQGLPPKNVAWGNMDDTNWKTLFKLSRSYHNVIFNTKIIADDIAKPMLKYLNDIFKKTTPNFILLMGHDANMYTLLKSLEFKQYVLPDQYEITPVGGNIVFQKWYDEKEKSDYFKVGYIYASFEQMRNGEKLNLNNPAKFKSLEINGCEVDENGFCHWSDFINLLQNKIQ